MIIKLHKKMIFGITGLPRSGTTIIGNIFNSADNAFCFCEPHWIMIREHWRNGFPTDKVSEFRFNGTENIMNSVSDVVFSSDKYLLGGVKETWRSGDIESFNSIKDFGADFIIFIFREPKSLYNRAKSCQTKEKPNAIDRFIKEYSLCYESTIEINSQIPVFSMSYEKLCKSNEKQNGTINYINSVLKGVPLSIEGNFVLKETQYLYGHRKAHLSTEVEEARTETDLLTDLEIEKINNSIYPMYKTIIGD